MHFLLQIISFEEIRISFRDEKNMNRTNEKTPLRRKPPWLKVPPPYSRQASFISATLAEHQLHSVCQEAACPNIVECFASKTATFLILGRICTRQCLYCNVEHGRPLPVDEGEIARLIDAVGKMQLKYVVITSVARDDLPDGGAKFFIEVIRSLRKSLPGCGIEALIPDFCGNQKALEAVIAAAPDVINHNMEAAPSFFSRLRPQGNYLRSLELLSRVAKTNVISKSGFMVGFGEKHDDILRLMDDLASVSCAYLTIGQYQQPTYRHWPVARYYSPEEFAALKEIGFQKGFQHVEAGPLVRSSYHAARARLLNFGKEKKSLPEQKSS